jgi:hypothetical protein
LIFHAEHGGGKTKLRAGLSTEVSDLRAQHIQNLTDVKCFTSLKMGYASPG